MSNYTYSILSSYLKICIYVYTIEYQTIYYDITVASCFHEVRNLISYVLFFNLQGTVKNLLGGFLSILTQADSDFQGALKLLVLHNSFEIILLLYEMKS